MLNKQKRRKKNLTAKDMPKSFPKIPRFEGIDWLELLREHPDLNTKPSSCIRSHKTTNNFCRGISELPRVDDDRKVVRHTPCFRSKQCFSTSVSFFDDFRFLALRIWPGRFQKKEYRPTVRLLNVHHWMMRADWFTRASWSFGSGGNTIRLGFNRFFWGWHLR